MSVLFKKGDPGVPKYVYLASSSAKSKLASGMKGRKGKAKHNNSNAAASSGDSDNKPRVINIQTKIGVASDVKQRIRQHNRDEPCMCRPTKAGAPGWVLEILLGPYRSGTNELAQQWRKGRRGLPSKFKQGLTLGWKEARRHGTPKVMAWNVGKGNAWTLDPTLSFLTDAKPPTAAAASTASASAAAVDEDGEDEGEDGEDEDDSEGGSDGDDAATDEADDGDEEWGV